MENLSRKRLSTISLPIKGAILLRSYTEKEREEKRGDDLEFVRHIRAKK